MCDLYFKVWAYARNNIVFIVKSRFSNKNYSLLFSPKMCDLYFKVWAYARNNIVFIVI